MRVFTSVLSFILLTGRVQAGWYIGKMISGTFVNMGQSFISDDRNTQLYIVSSTENGYPMSRIAAVHTFGGSFFNSVPNATSFGVTYDGRFVITSSSVAPVYLGTPQPVGTYWLSIDSASNAYIYRDGTNTVVWQSYLNTTGSDWGFKSVTGGSFLPQFGEFKNYQLYVLDGGATSPHQYFANPSAHMEAISETTSTIASLYKPPRKVALTPFNSSNFNEVDFVKAISTAVTDTNSGNVTKVINFSGAFLKNNSQVTNCAIQWAFKSGAYVISAAGNSNAKITNGNPYQLLVGAGWAPQLADGLLATTIGLSLAPQRIGEIVADYSIPSTAYQNPYWYRMPGGLVQVDHDGSVVCGVNSIWQIYCADQNIYQSPNWFQLPGYLVQLSVSAGRLVGVTSTGSIYYAANYKSPNWIQLPGNLVQVDIDGNIICGVTRYNEIFCSDSSIITSPNWFKLPGALIQVSVSQGRLYGVNSNKDVFYSPSYKTPAWVRVGSGKTLVKFDKNVVCALDFLYQIWCAGNDVAKPAFQQIFGGLSHVSVSNGRLYGVNAWSQIYSTAYNKDSSYRYFGSMSIPLDYSMSFDIIPYSARTNYEYTYFKQFNILHLTQTNESMYGNPEISFASGTTQLYIRVTCVDDHYWTFTDPTVLPLKQTSKVTLQVKGQSVQLWINGTLTSSLTQTCTRISGFTHLYVANPFMSHADVLLSNLRIGSPLLAERPVYKNAFISNNFVYRNFDLSFNLTLKALSKSRTSVLGFAVANSTSSSVPAVYVPAGTSKLQIEFRNASYAWSITTGQIITGTTTTVAPATQLALNKNTLVRLTLQSGQLNVWLDGVLAASSLVKFAWNGGTAALYLGDMTNAPAPALISDVIMNSINAAGELAGFVEPRSSYGPAINIWAPAQFNDMTINGTSIATAVVTAGINAALSKWPNELGFNPGRGYKYLTDLARTDILNVSDPKVVASNGNNKYLDLRKIPTQPPALGSLVPTPAPDYCSALGLKTVNWPALISKASPLNVGELVASFGIGATPKGMFKK